MRYARGCLLVLVLLLAAAGGIFAWVSRSTPTATFRTVPVARTDVRRTVSATGTLDAVTRVEVGTQVSGILAEVLVDFNDHVVKDQVLARLDTALLDADVASAAAKVAEAEANEHRLRLEAGRVTALRQRESATVQELEVATAELAVASAQLRTAQVGLTRARRNVGYATITAPIDGTIIRRDLDPGQTVNAGLSAPTLFLIAGDLAHMQILVAVDESDIGQIHEKQAAEFTVQAWPDRTFTGVVRQVRLQSSAEESVVTYTVVVDVDNADGVLLPGMTATVEFIVGEAKDALCVANAALRFTPEGAGDAGPASPASGAAPGAPPSASGGGPGGPSGRGGPGAKRRGKEPTEGTVWALDGATPRALPVKVGLRGSACSEVSGDGVTEGLALIVGLDRAAAGATASPLQPTAAPKRPGGF